MCMETEIAQTAGYGSHDNQFVGQQTNNYYAGMTPEQALSLTMDLFWKNFPKLQEAAENVARKRVEEFCTETIRKLQRDGTANYPALADPGVQYVLVDAQKNYARYGTQEMMNTLTELIYSRVKNNDDFVLKVTLDKAISVASMLTPMQLDYLSLLFLCTKVKHSHIKTLQDLINHLNVICNAFPVTVDQVSISYLDILGCMQLCLPDPIKSFSSAYSLDKNIVDTVCPQQIKDLATDYGLSYVGIILAIINAEQKTRFRFDPHIWIHE